MNSRILSILMATVFLAGTTAVLADEPHPATAADPAMKAAPHDQKQAENRKHGRHANHRVKHPSAKQEKNKEIAK